MSGADGLWIFVVVQWFNLNGLLLDLALWYLDQPTITAWCHRNPVGAWVLVAFQFLGVSGLAFHLFNGRH